jgi:hypothetical protein
MGSSKIVLDKEDNIRIISGKSLVVENEGVVIQGGNSVTLKASSIRLVGDVTIVN